MDNGRINGLVLLIAGWLTTIINDMITSQQKQQFFSSFLHNNFSFFLKLLYENILSLCHFLLQIQMINNTFNIY
jgi:hypothetical protein